MKKLTLMNTPLLFLFFFSVISVKGQLVDTAYVYANYYSADSTEIMFVTIASTGSTPCGISDTSINYVVSNIQIDLCYYDGSLTVPCTHTDTISLGIKLNGLYTVLAIFKQFDASSGQCKSPLSNKDSFEFVVNTFSTNILSMPDLYFSISPNPATNKLTVTTTITMLKSTITITNTTGAVVLQTTITNPNKNEIDVSALPAGLYFLSLQNEQRRVVRRFVKE